MNRIHFLRYALCLSLLLSTTLFALADTHAPSVMRVAAAAQAYSYEIIAERNHYPQLFTQGLLIHEGHFYESSGHYGQSRLVRYPVADTGSKWAQITNRFSREARLEPHYFAEGLTRFKNKLYLLTWREQTLLVYHPETFALEQKLAYTGEGWGLTHDDQHLIRSDGSDRLFFHESENFKLVRELSVRDGKRPVHRLNELEMIDGKIWANIWYANRVVEIDPDTGQVTGWLDLTPLVDSLKLNSSEQVLNGIAYDSEKKAIWITGKLWPKMFLIKISSPDQ